MDIKIGKKEFSFTKVSIWISEEYNHLTNMAYDTLYFSDDIEEITTEYAEKMKSAERGEIKLLKRKQEEKLKAKVQDSRDHTQAMFDKRMEILQELVELNGYDYDDNLWRRRATVEEINDILVDAVGSGSKKKLNLT